jgi:hypothetical protein
MDTFQEMYKAVQTDMNVLDEAPLYPLATVKKALNRSYLKCAGLFRWSGTEDAKKTSTQANIEYYDYPSNWRDDSIWRLEVDGTQYGETPDGSPLRFEDYLQWKSDPDNANSTDTKWANQKRRYFIYPVPKTAGNYNISVWGQKIVTQMVGDSDYTIFSYSMSECNEAVVLEAEAILKSQGEEEQAGTFRSQQAQQILVQAWNKIRQEQSKYEKTQPFFDVPDFFRQTGSGGQNTGNFN